MFITIEIVLEQNLPCLGIAVQQMGQWGWANKGNVSLIARKHVPINSHFLNLTPGFRPFLPPPSKSFLRDSYFPPLIRHSGDYDRGINRSVRVTREGGSFVRSGGLIAKYLLCQFMDYVDVCHKKGNLERRFLSS